MENGKILMVALGNGLELVWPRDLQSKESAKFSKLVDTIYRKWQQKYPMVKKDRLLKSGGKKNTKSREFVHPLQSLL